MDTVTILKVDFIHKVTSLVELQSIVRLLIEHIERRDRADGVVGRAAVLEMADYALARADASPHLGVPNCKFLDRESTT